MVGDHGTIRRSADLGHSGLSVRSGTDKDLLSVWADPKIGFWAVGDDGVMLRSVDKGISWHPVSTGLSTRLFAISIMGDDVYAVGAGGKITHSSDGGRRWKIEPSGTTEWLLLVSQSRHA
jgi:photosystem II stability/assembly factor-like uncharacterized protein